MNLQYKIFRSLVFKIGHTRWLGFEHFPFILTWARIEHKVDLNEVDLSKYSIQEGDIILHRDEWFASNLGIPGVMIHAGLVVQNDDYKTNQLIPYQIVEAVSEGVVKRNIGNIVHSDYVCILRPKLTEEHKAEAASWARRIVGFEYDPLFDFNSEEERQFIKDAGNLIAIDKVKFCCTEIPHFCYLEHVGELGIFRRKNRNILTKLLGLIGLHPGEEIVTADMYIEAAGLDIVWMSKSYTLEWAKSIGASEAHLFKIAGFLGKKV